MAACVHYRFSPRASVQGELFGLSTMDGYPIDFLNIPERHKLPAVMQLVAMTASIGFAASTDT